MVHERRIFFHPPGKGGYPKEPAEMLAFRYDAHLQALGEIEEVLTAGCHSELSRFVPEIDGDACRRAYDNGKPVMHFVYRLKPITRPTRIIPSGRVFQAAKVKAYLSLLQSCDSISDAVEQTRLRQNRGV